MRHSSMVAARVGFHPLRGGNVEGKIGAPRRDRPARQGLWHNSPAAARRPPSGGAGNAVPGVPRPGSAVRRSAPAHSLCFNTVRCIDPLLLFFVFLFVFRIFFRPGRVRTGSALHPAYRKGSLFIRSCIYRSPFGVSIAPSRGGRRSRSCGWSCAADRGWTP